MAGRRDGMSALRAYEIVVSPDAERCRQVLCDDRFDRFPGKAERFDWWFLRTAELVDIALDRERLIDPRADR